MRLRRASYSQSTVPPYHYRFQAVEWGANRFRGGRRVTVSGITSTAEAKQSLTSQTIPRLRGHERAGVVVPSTLQRYSATTLASRLTESQNTLQRGMASTACKPDATTILHRIYPRLPPEPPLPVQARSKEGARHAQPPPSLLLLPLPPSPPPPSCCRCSPSHHMQ